MSNVSDIFRHEETWRDKNGHLWTSVRYVLEKSRFLSLSQRGQSNFQWPWSQKEL
jgi:hypothetical protein